MKAPDLYEEDIRRYCDYKKLTLDHVFSDLDRSGFRGAPSRPALEELKRRHLEFSAVIVPKLARFGRSVKELVELFDLFDRSGVSLVFLDMNIDTSTSQGRLLRHIMAAFASCFASKSHLPSSCGSQAAKPGSTDKPQRSTGYGR